MLELTTRKGSLSPIGRLAAHASPAPAETEAGPSSSLPPASGSGPRLDGLEILMVDDEPRNLDALEAVLEQDGYRLLRAEDADQALALLLVRQVATILLDIRMPRVDGLELARIIKGSKRFKDVPILFLTAHLLDDKDALAGYDAGAVDYLTKPFNPRVLREKVAFHADLFEKSRALAKLNAELEDRVRERTADLERSEQALKTAAKEKDVFIATLAHELRNPLVPLRTGLDLLMQTRHGDPRPGDEKKRSVVERALAAMNRQLDHIVRLIDDLLDVSRLSSGAFTLKFEHVELTTLVKNAVEPTQRMRRQKNLALSVSTPTRLSAIVDPTRLAQIVGNLLHNACKFTPQDGAVRLELEQHDEDFVVRVTDTGIGIDPDDMEHVFEMFAQTGNGAAAGGAGIGLALARKLAQMHGGTLTASSAGQGHGATFSLKVPLAPPKAMAQLPAEGPLSRTQSTALPVSVLVIEDNPDVADTLEALLTSLGNAVTVATTGADGLEHLQRFRPSLILCDIGLPDLDGYEVCRSVRGLNLNYRPTMVALTGWGNDADRELSRQAGFDAHLLKPVTLEVVRGILQTANENAQE